MRVLASISLAFAACYAEPDYDGTRFRCDAVRGCPPGQTCIGGFCTTVDGGTMPFPDGGAGSVSCDTATCASPQHCCVDFINPPRCIPAGASCGGFAAACDGIEDCGGSPCCDLGSGSIGCGTTCSNRICRDEADCPTTLQCCFGATGTNEPWGRCFQTCP